MEVTLDTASLRGSLGRNISVYSNASNAPSLFLTLRATILAGVELYPQTQIMMDNRKPELHSARLLIRKVITQPGQLVVSDVVASADWLAVSARPLEPDSPGDPELPEPWPGDWLLEIAFDGPPSNGRTQQAVRFKTGLDLEPDVEVPIDVMGWPPVNISTERLVLEASPAEAPKIATVVFSLRRGLDPELLEVEGEPSSIGIRFEKSGRRHFKLHASWQGGDEREGAIHFKLGRESFRLPVELRPGS